VKNNQRRIATLIFLSLLIIFSSQVPSNALFGPKSGEKCNVKGETKKIGGVSHVCEKSKDGQNRWLINSAPKDRDAALGLVLQNCGSDYDGKYSVYIYPRMIFGAVIQKTIESGEFTPDKKAESILDYEISKSQEMSSKFEMASTLDPKWNRINTFWTAAINSAFKRWQSGGVNQLEASIASQSNLDSVESICKVAAKNGLSAADKEKRTVLSWMARVTSGY
jgi:hypothetical protein